MALHTTNHHRNSMSAFRSLMTPKMRMSLKMKESKKKKIALELKTAEMRTHIDHNSIYNLTTSARLTENDIIVETGN